MALCECLGTQSLARGHSPLPVTVPPTLSLEASLFVERWLSTSQTRGLTGLPEYPPNREDRSSKDPKDPAELAAGSSGQVVSPWASPLVYPFFLHSPISQGQSRTSFGWFFWFVCFLFVLPPSPAVCPSRGCTVKLRSAATTLLSDG